MDIAAGTSKAKQPSEAPPDLPDLVSSEKSQLLNVAA
jgi:hypothetical protein